MKYINILALFAVLLVSCTEKKVLTTKALLTQSSGLRKLEKVLPIENTTADVEINIDTSVRYQQMEGFGYTLTGGSASHISHMDTKTQDSLLNALFDQNELGISYLRLSLGASDLDPFPWSYNDLETDGEDLQLARFNLSRDTLSLIPILKKIKTINPSIQLMASPWSAPTWMKDNKDSRGGKLLKNYYPAYALYFLKYIRAMADEGIKINAVTIQNEPHHPGNNPSMFMSADDQIDFVANHLGPLFEANQIESKIIIWDHNADEYDYPIHVLSNPKANSYIDGSAFHLYAGSISALTKVHDAFPSKNVYFTEQWTGAPGDFSQDFSWHFEQLMLGAPNNWAKVVLEWNLSNNSQLKPHTDRGGCTSCLGAITIAQNKVIANPSYYVMAHTAPFVRPGADRVSSTQPENFPNTAYENEDGSISLLLYNKTEQNQIVQVSGLDEEFFFQVPQQAALSVNFKWN